jgi:hypothetical protein
MQYTSLLQTNLKKNPCHTIVGEAQKKRITKERVHSMGDIVLGDNNRNSIKIY